MGCGVNSKTKINSHIPPTVGQPQKKIVPPINGGVQDKIIPSKKEEPETTAKDIIGRNIDAKLDLEPSLSLTDIAANAFTLIKAVVYLIESYRRRSQILKALLRRMKSLETTFTELQKNNFKFSKEGITNLIYIVNKMKDFCEEITRKPKSIFDQAARFLSANSQMKELVNFDELLTKTLDDLKVPLTLEEINLQKETMHQVKELNDKVVEILKNVEGNGVKVVGLAKKNLTNEEAFNFWVECFPEKYLVQVQEFSTIFKDYICGYKEVELEKKQVDLIIKMIKADSGTSDGEIMISAKELNTFFENLPLEVQWDKLETIEKKVEGSQNKRIAEVGRKRTDLEMILQKKVEEIRNEETKEEKDLIEQGKYTRFLVKEAWISSSNVKTEIKLRNIFIMCKDGSTLAFGTDKIGEFTLSGNIEDNGKFSLTRAYRQGQGEEKIIITGSLGVNNGLDGTLSFLGKSSKGKVMISLDVDHWYGYYLQNDYPHDMQTGFKIVGNKMTGISTDDVGAAIWFGNITTKELHMVKQYIGQHSVKYDGHIMKSGVVTEIKGNWDIHGYSDGFFFSHNDEDTE